MSLFCKHDWQTVSDVVFPSDFEQAMQISGDAKKIKGSFTYTKTHIFIMICRNCGKYYRSIVTR